METRAIPSKRARSAKLQKFMISELGSDSMVAFFLFEKRLMFSRAGYRRRRVKGKVRKGGGEWGMGNRQ